jgi:hypothetical protein
MTIWTVTRIAIQWDGLEIAPRVIEKAFTDEDKAKLFALKRSYQNDMVIFHVEPLEVEE